MRRSPNIPHAVAADGILKMLGIGGMRGISMSI